MNANVPLKVVVAPADLGAPRACARLDAFVREHPAGSVFHLPAWSRTVERGCGQRPHYLMAERAGALVGILPLTEMRSRLFGNALVSVGFGTGGGILADSDAIGAELARVAWELARRRGSASLELRGGLLPEGWQAQHGVYASFERALPDKAEAVLGSIPRRQRAEVRRAFDHGLEVTAGSDERHQLAHFRVYSESVRNLGTPVFPPDLFQAALDEFGTDAEILVVWKQGQPLAALFNFHYERSYQAYWGGGTAEARAWRANDLIWYEAMTRAIRRGCTRADFGRSKVGTGPWRRKRIWGLVETPLVYGVRTAGGQQPREINPLDPKYRLQVAAWQRLPLWIANRVGPVISRGLG